MSRVIPINLANHISQEATTVAILVKITPVTPGYPSYGVTSLDRDIPYDDGTGTIIYRSAIGMTPSAIAESSDLSVNNAEVEHLIPEFDIPEVSEEAIRAGVYNYARHVVYLINYANPTDGHVTLHAGTIGEVKILSDGLSFINELRGLSAAMKQSICERDSLTCRAVFGSQPIGSSTPGPQVKHGWCGFDAESLLVSDEVVDVGLESTLNFQMTVDSSWEDGALAPGIIKFLTGDNAGLTMEIADNDDSGWITLAHEAPFPIQIGDTCEYRPDCNKHARNESKGCKRYHGVNWILHFRGEPDIPLGDEAAMMMPSSFGGADDDE